MAKFDKYFSKLIAHEGGFVNHPNDPGGATNLGITLATLRGQRVDVDGDGDSDINDLKKLTKARALPVYKRAYWDTLLLDTVVSQSVAEIIFDHGVNAGVSRAAKMAQHTLKTIFRKEVLVDGKFGPKSVEALNSVDPAKFFERFKYLRQSYYKYRADQSEKGLSEPVNIFFHRDLKVSPSASAKVFLKGWLNRVETFKYVG